MPDLCWRVSTDSERQSIQSVGTPCLRIVSRSTIFTRSRCGALRDFVCSSDVRLWLSANCDEPEDPASSLPKIFLIRPMVRSFLQLEQHARAGDLDDVVVRQHHRVMADRIAVEGG